jgi:hypothetical protein
MPALMDQLQEYASISLLLIKDPIGKIRTRKEYMAMENIIFMRYYSSLVFARMLTPFDCFPSMLEKWLSHARGPMLPCEREAMQQALNDQIFVIAERGALGEELDQSILFQIRQLTALIEEQLRTPKSKRG